jgi:hypothetical protein
MSTRAERVGGVPGGAVVDGSISEGGFMEREREGDLGACRVATGELIEVYAGSFIECSTKCVSPGRRRWLISRDVIDLE